MTNTEVRLQNLESLVNQMQRMQTEQAQELKDLKAAAHVPEGPRVLDVGKIAHDYLLTERLFPGFMGSLAGHARTHPFLADQAKAVQEDKAVQEAKAAQEAKATQEAKAAQEAKEAKAAKLAQDLATIDMVATRLEGSDIPGIRNSLSGVDKATVVSTAVRGRNLLECLSEFQGCSPTPELVKNKWYAMNILLLDYPWTDAQIEAAMAKFLPLALTSSDDVPLKHIIKFEHTFSKKPLVTFDQVQKVVAAENLFGRMSAKHVKLMVSLMSA